MPKFQVHDTVALKDDKSFVGSIERTSQFDSEPLDECLIIAHTKVPGDVIQDFVLSGSPPSGYAFVQFASQEKGSSLVAEDDLVLIDRIFDLGDVVKQRASQLTGTVVNVSSSYVLDPIWQPKLTNDGFAAKPTDQGISQPRHNCDVTCNSLDPRIYHPQPQRLIPNVPFEELKRAQDFIEGDYVIEQEWLGVVDAVEMLVVVKLENDSVVVVAEPEELFIPIPEWGKPLVSLPEYDGITRPHYVVSQQGWGNTIPPEDLECGQFVVTNQRNLRQGRWLRGSWSRDVKPQGHVLMVKCRRLSVQWLICNPLTPEHHWNATKPDNSLPYENLSTFPAPQEIRRDKRIVLYDPSKHASSLDDRTRTATHFGHHQTTKNGAAINLSSNFGVGQQVKFRDPAGAAVKYQGRSVDSTSHGRFDRILHNETFGYDLNEFDIVHSQQKAFVQWQDGTTSEHLSTDLNKVALFESDLMPADIVVARDGMKQRQNNSENDQARTEFPLVDFNEMTFFEKQHDLLPEKVGIVQSVSPSERVATVRWFLQPKIRITNSGNSLGSDARFGTLGDQTEDVSLYEVMSFNGLMRKIRDIVVVPPSSPSREALDVINEIELDDLAEVDASVTTLSQIPDRHPQALLEWMQHNARKSLDAPPAAILDPELYRPHRSVDWIGEICQLRTDGMVAIRVNVDDQAKDVLIEHDQILALVDEQIWGVDYNEDPMDLGDDDSEASEMTDDPEEVLAEVVEYEGGQRIDDDPGDENWESEDEHEKRKPRARNGSIVMTDAETKDLAKPKRNLAQPTTHTPARTSTLTKPEARSLATYLPSDEPPAFVSLDQEPPADQFRASQPSQTSSTFLKRIAKEHRILSTSLPKHEIYVRTYDSRLDLLRCLIVGPADTPYEYAPFLIDLHLGPGFPREPPTAHFHSWTSGMGRINPNLYEEGKICLSLLGTWPGKSESEVWTEKATILQLLVSLQGLVFVKAPFYNEAGFEGYEETREYTVESLQYSEKAYVMGRNFVKHALSRPVAGLEDVLAWLYLTTKQRDGQLAESHVDDSTTLDLVIARSHALISRSEELRGPSKQLGGEDDEERLLSGDGECDDPTKVFLRPLSKGAFVMLHKTLKALKDILASELATIADAPTTNKEKPTKISQFDGAADTLPDAGKTQDGAE